MKKQLAVCLWAVSFALFITRTALAQQPGLGTFTTIELPNATLTIAFGINPRGDIVGRYDSAGVAHGYLLSGGEFSMIDFLVNNAGIDVIGSVLDTPWSEWRRVLETNLLGCVYCTRAVVKVMIEGRVGGRIVNISSINALLGWRNRSAYSASKAGVNAFTRCAALELGAFGINVNAVAPGSIDTPIWGETLTPAVREAHAKRTATGRIGVPEDVEGVVAFLLSDAAQYITGQVIAVDGGRSVTDYVPNVSISE